MPGGGGGLSRNPVISESSNKYNLLNMVFVSKSYRKAFIFGALGTE